MKKNPFLYGILTALLMAGCARQPAPVAGPTLTAPATGTPLALENTAAAVLPALATPTPGSALGADPASLRGIHIRFWYSGSPEFQRAMDVEIRRFNAGNAEGVWVESNYVGSFEGLPEALSGNTKKSAADLVLTYPALAAAWSPSAPALANIQGYLDDSRWGLPPGDLANLIPEPPARSSDKRTIRGFPGYRTGYFLFYNQGWAEALGFSQPPRSLDDFRSQACAAATANLKDKSPDKNGTGGWIAADDAAAVLSWLDVFGGAAARGVGGVYQFAADPLAKTMTFMQQMNTQGCAWLARNPDPSGYFANRQALFFSGSSGDILGLESFLTLNKFTDRWAVLPYPGQDGIGRAFGDGPDYYLVASTPERQLAAWLFVRAMFSAESQARLAEASGVFPVNQQSKDALAAFLTAHPQWAEAYTWSTRLKILPQDASWLTARPVLEDAFGQLFQPSSRPPQVSGIIEMLNQTIQEVSTPVP